MKKINLNKFIFCGLLILSGCAHSLHQVYVSADDKTVKFDESKIVKASADQFVVLGITDDTSYVEKAYNKLKTECPGKGVAGITTQFSTSLGFFSWTNKVLMQGYCTL